MDSQPPVSLVSTLCGPRGVLLHPGLTLLLPCSQPSGPTGQSPASRQARKARPRPRVVWRLHLPSSLSPNLPLTPVAPAVPPVRFHLPLPPSWGLFPSPRRHSHTPASLPASVSRKPLVPSQPGSRVSRTFGSAGGQSGSRSPHAGTQGAPGPQGRSQRKVKGRNDCLWPWGSNSHSPPLSRPCILVPSTLLPLIPRIQVPSPLLLQVQGEKAP